MPSFVDFSGRKFGRLIVSGRAPTIKKKTFWHCKCACGNKCVSRADSLLDGLIRSCGCLHSEWAASPKGFEKGKSRVERFEERYIPEPNSGCWLWIGPVNETTGYGRFYINEKLVIYAHKFSFEYHTGQIPAGLFLRHTCDIKICVNPEHIIPGTRKQNAEDAVERGLYLTGVKHPMHKLVEAEVLDIFLSEEPTAAIAARFSISRIHVQRIKEQKVWKELFCAL